MSRGPRHAPGGFVYHVLNRAVARLPLFEKPADYEAFLRVVAEALEGGKKRGEEKRGKKRGRSSFCIDLAMASG
jgi:hypothetical protein